jgi:hypothetical protein
MEIYERLNQVMQTVGAIGKDSRNQQQGYKFRGIDAVMNALYPAFSKFGIFVVPQVLEYTREERTNSRGTLLISSICKVKYTFYANDGSSVEAVVVGEGMDSGDKSMNKAMSAAFKYACFQVLCIPTEEMKDSEDDSPNPVSREQQAILKKEQEEQKRMAEPIDATKRLALLDMLARKGKTATVPDVMTFASWSATMKKLEALPDTDPVETKTE